MKKIPTFILFFSVILSAADFYGPAPFVDILNRSFTKSWTPQAISTVENRAHVVILDAGTQQYCLSVTSGTMNGVEVVAVSSLNDASGTYGKVLRSMFQIQDVNIESLSTDSLTGEYTLRPELMIYYGIDSNSSIGSSAASSLQVSRIKAVQLTDYSETGYLAFSFSGTPSSCVAQVTKRYVLNTSTGALEQDTSWSSNQWLKFGASGVELVTSQSDATNIMLASSLDLIDVANNPGEGFNPTSIDWQTNAFAAWPTKNGVVEVTSIANSSLNSLRDGTAGDNIDPQYRQQFGTSTEATAVASAYLDQIEAALSNSGESLRYPKQLYLTARANMLSHTFGAIDEVNAELGESTVPFVYFTNAQDSSDVYHPFMVVGTRNGTGGPNFLIDVARPPGDGSGNYETSTITRNAFLTNGLYRIPMKDYGLVANLKDNDLSTYNNLAKAAGISSDLYDVYNYASYSVSGLTLDGVKIYPSYNNTLYFTPMNAEITSTGVHVGQGMTLHSHADGHSFNGNGINLYNLDDYVGKQHPPLIGFGLDGVAIYGKYESNYSSMDGFSVALDEYGGHDHDDYGYHYHAHAQDVNQTDKRGVEYAFTQHFLMVGAYRGNINNIPDFQNGGTNQLKDGELARYVGLEGTYVTTSFKTTTQHTVNTSVANSSFGSVSGAGTYDYNSSVTLTATPSANYIFSGWSGDASGTTNPLTLTLTQDLNVTASFTPNLWINSNSLGDNWYKLGDSFGTYYQSAQSWIYHLGMGWLYPASETSDSVWLYKVGRGWMYMKITDFPYLWDAKTMYWAYYGENNGQPSLYEYTSTEWVAFE